MSYYTPPVIRTLEATPFKDFTICCQGVELMVNKCIVSQHSELLKLAIAHSAVYDVPFERATPSTVRLFFRAMYGECDDDADFDAHAVDMLHLASFFDSHRVSVLAVDALIRRFDTTPSLFWPIAAVAVAVGVERLIAHLGRSIARADGTLAFPSTAVDRSLSDAQIGAIVRSMGEFEAVFDRRPITIYIVDGAAVTSISVTPMFTTVADLRAMLGDRDDATHEMTFNGVTLVDGTQKLAAFDIRDSARLKRTKSTVALRDDQPTVDKPDPIIEEPQIQPAKNISYGSVVGAPLPAAAFLARLRSRVL